MMRTPRASDQGYPTGAPRLSIVIVTYNSHDQIDACLSSLSTHPPSMEHEVTVVDNASGDGTVAAVQQGWPDVHVIETGRNLGFAAASNAGMRKTSGEFVLLLNPDTRVTAGAIDALTAHLVATPDAAVVGPRIVDGDGRAEVSFGAMIGPVAELRQKLLVTGSARVPLVRAYVDRITRDSKDVDWVSGACLLVRREDAEAVGLLDERYFMYTEDVDFCASIRARHRRVLFTADAEVVHLRGRSVASAPRPTDMAYRRSQLAFYEKHHPRWAPILRAYLTLRRRLPDKQGVMPHDQGRPSP
ncbi:MAG: glycosyltransferase family 2 protein [Acidobacteria bacterium]|nr:glycosyltransferase family 2 protein [Acidobacteriota bacterium]